MKSAAFLFLLLMTGFARPAHAIGHGLFDIASTIDPNVWIGNFQPENSSCSLLNPIEKASAGGNCVSPDDRDNIDQLLRSGYQARKLASISTDDEATANDVSELQTVTDGNGELQGIAFQSIHRGQGSVPQIKRSNFDIRDMTRKQVVLMCNHNAVKLQIYMRPGANVGSMRVWYLTNGIWGNYASCDATLERVGNRWQIINNATRQPVTDIFVKRQALGISTLGNLCN